MSLQAMKSRWMMLDDVSCWMKSRWMSLQAMKSRSMMMFVLDDVLQEIMFKGI